jgi:hypothetical protein
MHGGPCRPTEDGLDLVADELPDKASVAGDCITHLNELFAEIIRDFLRGWRFDPASEVVQVGTPGGELLLDRDALPARQRRATEVVNDR